MQFVNGEAWQVGIFKDVGSVLVVIGVRDPHAHLVQLGCPAQFAQVTLSIRLAQHRCQQGLRCSRHTFCL